MVDYKCPERWESPEESRKRGSSCRTSVGTFFVPAEPPWLEFDNARPSENIDVQRERAAQVWAARLLCSLAKSVSGSAPELTGQHFRPNWNLRYPEPG